MNDIRRAMEDLRRGRFVLVHDAEDREGETDFVMASAFVTPQAVRTMRTDGGGLICVTVHESIYKSLGLPFMTDIYSKVHSKYPLLKHLVPNDIPYDTKSAFSITVNHRKTFTGITDNDRALTISELGSFFRISAQFDSDELKKEFGKRFRSPGHVHLLNASEGLLDTRLGHTELTTALMLMAGMTPSAAICEMMGNDGTAKTKKESAEYAVRNNLVHLTGEEITAEWMSWKKNHDIQNMKNESQNESHIQKEKILRRTAERGTAGRTGKRQISETQS